MAIRKQFHVFESSKNCADSRESIIDFALPGFCVSAKLFDAISEANSATEAEALWSEIRGVINVPYQVPFFWAVLQGVKRYGYAHEALEFAVGYDGFRGMFDRETNETVITDAVQAGMEANPVYASLVAAEKYADEHCDEKFNRKGKPLNKQQFWYREKMRVAEFCRLESIRKSLNGEA